MLGALGQIVASVRPSVLLGAIFCCLLLVGLAILWHISSYWLIGPLLLATILMLGLIYGVSQDIEGIAQYLDERNKSEPVNWDTLVSGPLNRLHDSFVEAFKVQLRRNAEYQDAVREMGHSSLELSSNAREVSRSAADQSSVTTSSAAAITEISQSIDDISQRIIAARDAATEACHLSRSGSEALAGASREVVDVTQLARTMETKVKQLDQLIHNVTAMSQILSDIAGQTNLLALNAAIEAARAGDQGRGFAVVADEVRSLAVRSQGSAADIAQNISGVKTVMEQVSESMAEVVSKAEKSHSGVGQADAALQAILTTTEAVFSSIDEIAVASQQQSSAAREISQHIEVVASLANQNSFRASQAAEIAEHLHRLTHQAE